MQDCLQQNIWLALKSKLKGNIIGSPQDDYEDTVLAEYLKEDIERIRN